MREGDDMLKVPGRFLVRLREPVDWSDLRYAYANQIIDGKAVIDHACRVLSESETDNDELLAIASAKETDQLESLLDQLAGSFEPTPDTRRKWALIMAAFICESEIADKLDAVEEVYSSFDYPEELAGMVRYMPISGADLGSKEANESRMLNLLKELTSNIVISG